MINRGRSVWLLAGLLFSVSFSMFSAPVAQAISSNGQGAINALGQNTVDGSVNYNSNTVNNPINLGMNGPSGMVVDSINHIAYAVDTGNNRVLVYQLGSDNSFHDYDADFVIGQPDFSETAANRGLTNPSANSLRAPSAVAIEPGTGRVYLADAGNNRVLVFNSVNQDDPSAVNVVGAADFTTNNSSGVVASNRMYTPSGITFSGEPGNLRVYISDRDFNRILVFSQVNANNQSALHVIGQTGFFSSSASLSQSGLASPAGLTYSDDGILYVADSGNNRIMIWTSPISGDNQNANQVLGQTWFYSSNSGTSSTSLSQPQGVSVGESGEVMVADSNNNRVMVWTSPVTISGQAANIVIGQSNFNSSLAGVGPTKYSLPMAISSSGGMTIVADARNNRIIVYSSTITSSGQAASLTIGQITDSDTVDFYGNTLNNPQNRGMNRPSGMAVDSIGGRLFVSDTENNRVLVFNLDGTNNVIDRSADLVLGQQTFSTTLVNSGGSPSASSMNSPTGLFYDESLQRLYVADTGNNRVLVFTNNIKESGQPANFVIGQSGFTSVGPAATRSGMASPESISVNTSNGMVAVADRDNNRVLLWSSHISRIGQPADFVLGQSNFNSSNFGTSASSLRTPKGVYFDSNMGYLYVADTDNNRVLVWTVGVEANNQSANRVLGQPNMSSSASVPVTSQSMNRPSHVAVGASSGVLYVADTGNNRALVYKSTILVDGQQANSVVGQSSMSAHVSAISRFGLRSPGSIIANPYNGQVYVADTANNRVMIYGNTGPSAPNATVPSNGATNVSSLPVFQVNASDPDGDALQYRIEVASDADFTNNVIIHNQATSSTGWYGQNIGNTYGLGATAAFSLPSKDILSASTTYYWRVYSYDRSGSKTWSEASEIKSFTTASPDNISANSSQYTVEAGRPSSSIAVGLRDINGNSIISNKDTRVYLFSNSPSGEFSLESSPFTPVDSVTIPANTDSVRVYYKDSKVGNYILSMSDSETPDGDVGLRDYSFEMNVTASVVAYFSYSSLGTYTAGEPFEVSIVANDIYGNTAADFSDTVILNSTNDDIEPESIQFASGSWTGEVILTQSGNVRLTSLHGTLFSHSPFFTINPSVIDHAVISPGNPTIKAGTDTQFSATAHDMFGNLIESSVSYQWSVDPSIGSLSNLNGSQTTLAAADLVEQGLVSVVATKESAVESSTNVTLIPHHYSFIPLNDEVIAGVQVPVTISARSANEVLISNSTSIVTVKDETNTIEPKSLSVIDGIWSGSLLMTQAIEDNKIVVESADSSVNGESNIFAVVPAQVATIIVSPGSLSMSVNTQLPISVQAVDQFNNPIKDLTYNWTTTIGSTPTTGREINFSAGSISGTGTAVVSVTQSGSTVSANIPVSITSLGVHHFSFSVIPEQVAGRSFQVTISAKDQYNNTVTNFTGNGAITYSAGTIKPTNTADFSSGSWTGSIKVTKAAESASLSFNSSGFSGSSNSFRVSPNVLSSININPGSISIPLEQTQQFNASAYDTHGNEILSGVQFTWSVNDSALGSLSPLVGSSTNMNTKTKSGTTYINVVATEDTVTVNNSVLVTVTPGSLETFAFDTISSPQPTGELVPVKITAKDTNNNTLTSFNSPVILSDKSGTINPVQTTNFSDGVWSGYVRISNVYNNNTITATSGLVSGSSNEFDVISNILDHVVISPSSSNVTVGQTQAFSAQGYDVFGNAIVGLNYSWSVIGAAGSISPVNGLATTFTASPATGTGIVRVVVSQGNLSVQANATVKVLAGALNHFTFTPIPDVTAGQATYATITAKDVYNNTINSFANEVNLTDDLGGVVSSSIGPFSQGVWTGQISFQKSGLNRLAVSHGAVRTQSDTFTVSPDVLYAADINPDPLRIAAGKTATLIGFGKDRFGNVLEDVSYTWSVPSSIGSLSSFGDKEVTVNASNRSSQGTINLIVSSGPTLVSKSVDATVTSDTIAQFVISQINSPQIAGSPFQVTATAADQYGNTVTNFTDTASLTDGTGTISPTQTSSFVNGVWSGSLSVTQTTDNNYVTFRSGSVQSQSNQFSVEAGEQQVFLTVSSGGNQTAATGSKLGAPLIVKAVDLYNNPMPDIPINYTIDSTPAEASGTTMTPEIVNTDGEGVAMSELRLGNRTGSYIVTASIEGRSSVGVTFYASATAAPVASVKVSPSSTTLLVGSSQLFTAQAFDSYGNEISSINTEWAVVAGGGSINSEGMFTAGSTTRVYTNTIAATVNGVTGYSSVTVTTLPGITGDNREGAGEIERLTLTPLEPSVTVGNSVGFTVLALDRYNQEVDPAELAYSWDSVGGSILASDSAATTFTASESPEPASVSVQVTQLGKQLVESIDTSITIKNNPQGYLLLVTPDDNIVSGEEFKVSIIAYNGDGTINDDFEGPVELADSTQTITPRITTKFEKGNWSGVVAINSGETATVIKASGQQVSGVSRNLEIADSVSIARSDIGGILGIMYNFVAESGETMANFFQSFLKTSGSYPETTKNVAAAGVASLGFIAAAISFGRVASSGMIAIGRNPYARRKMLISMVGAFVVSLVFAGLSFLIAGFIKFL